MKSFILGFVLVLAAIMSPAQQLTNAPAVDTNSLTANQVPVSQASDDVIKKLSDLVHDGKYAEAQQLAAGLLLAYPDDQRLIKAKTLLDKLIAASNISQPTNSVAQPAASGASEQLTGMDKVDYDSLIELGREAQQTTDLDQQKILLQQFIDKSQAFLKKYPDEILLWQVLAASALSLGDPLAGYEAGQHLLAADGANSSDANQQQLLSKLNLKDWLDKDRVIVTGHNFEIQFSEWYQAILSSRAKAELIDGQSVNVQGHVLTKQETQNGATLRQPTIILSRLIFQHLLQEKSNAADLVSAKKDAEDAMAASKALWLKKHGAEADFEKYPKSFGMTMDEYRSFVIQSLTPFETEKRLKLKLGDSTVINKLFNVGGVKITDPDLKRMLDTPQSDDAQNPQGQPRP